MQEQRARTDTAPRGQLAQRGARLQHVVGRVARRPQQRLNLVRQQHALRMQAGAKRRRAGESLKHRAHTLSGTAWHISLTGPLNGRQPGPRTVARSAARSNQPTTPPSRHVQQTLDTGIYSIYSIQLPSGQGAGRPAPPPHLQCIHFSRTAPTR